MAKFLSGNRCPLRLAIAVAILGTLAFAGWVYAHPGQYSADFTAYAMGHLKGAANVEVEPGMFAGHYCSWCPDDPACSWAWGTTIDMVNPPSISIPDQNGNDVEYSEFELEDIGDPSCAMSNYWVDVYFGRWRRQGEPCECSGVSDSVCYYGQTNSCDNAINFGRHWYTYTGP